MQIVEAPRTPRLTEVYELRCGKCGCHLELRVEPEKKICPRCGSALDIQWSAPRSESLN